MTTYKKACVPHALAVATGCTVDDVLERMPPDLRDVRMPHRGLYLDECESLARALCPTSNTRAWLLRRTRPRLARVLRELPEGVGRVVVSVRQTKRVFHALTIDTRTGECWSDGQPTELSRFTRRSVLFIITGLQAEEQ